MSDASSTRSHHLRNGMIAAGLGLLGWAATRRKGPVRDQLNALGNRLGELVPGLRSTVESAIPTLREGFADLRGRLGLRTSEQPPVDHLQARRALRALPPVALQDAVTTGWSTLDSGAWHAFGLDLVHALQTAGVHTSRLTDDLRLSTNDVYDMQPDDFGRLVAFAQQSHPDVLAQVLVEHAPIAGALHLQQA